MPPLAFTLPIAPCDAHPGGTLAGTEPSPGVYVLTLTSPPDNRLTSAVCTALLTALDLVEFGPGPPGVLVTTSGLPKFYSNGLDLAHAVAADGFWPLLYSVWRRLLTFPMPTVALLNGHAFAGGLMTAMAHDYRLAPAPRGFLCVNELLFGAPLPPAMAALFRHKVSPATYRTLVLEARRFDAPQAVAAGIADAVAHWDAAPPAEQDAAAAAALAPGLRDCLRFIDERGLRDKAKTGVYGTLKEEMYKDLIAFLRSPTMEAEDQRFAADRARDAERNEFGKVWYEQWLKDQDKAKL